MDNKPLPASIPALTAARFFMALYVIIFHFTLYLDIRVNRYTELFSKGYLGVDFFFILSGVVLAHVYIDKLQAGSFKFVSFIQKRFARIYPIHFVTLAILVCFAGVIDLAGLSLDAYVPWERFERNLSRWDSIVPQLFLLHGLGIFGEGWNYPSWSISSEWGAYLCFPLFAGAALFFAKRSVWGSALYLAGLMATFFASGIYLGIESFAEHVSVWKIFFEFQIGVAALLLCRKITLPKGFLQLFCVLSLLFFLAFNHFSITAIAPMKDYISVVVIAGLIGAMVLLSKHSGGQSKIPQSLIYLGEISYGMYMWHAVIELFYFQSVAHYLGYKAGNIPLALWLPVFPLIIAVAAIGFHTIEEPARKKITAFKR